MKALKTTKHVLFEPSLSHQCTLGKKCGGVAMIVSKNNHKIVFVC